MQAQGGRSPRHQLRKKAALNAASADGLGIPHPADAANSREDAASTGSRGPAAPAPASGPVPWSDYFDRRLAVACPERGATFNVYLAGTSGPVVMCLHGGGLTGMSWALVAKLLAPRCRVVACDLRGHGLTQADDEGDLSAETLAADVVSLWAAMFAAAESAAGDGGDAATPPRSSTKALVAAGGPPATLLVGHSMGGAISVRAASLQAIPSLAGVVVVDVVEGTALASLPFMQSILQRRPASFPSLHAAVRWAVDSGTCRSTEAAWTTLPSMLIQRSEGAGTGSPPGVGCRRAGDATPAALVPTPAAPGALSQENGRETRPMVLETVPEDSEVDDTEQTRERTSACLPAAAAAAVSAAGGSAAARRGGDCSEAGWVWRTPLEQSCQHWEGWYLGLSEAFLALAVPLVLILAGTDRLDTALTVAQMQGRFQLVLLPRAGHAVHEDEPERVADTIAQFITRFRVGAQVSKTLAAGAQLQHLD